MEFVVQNFNIICEKCKQFRNIEITPKRTAESDKLFTIVPGNQDNQCNRLERNMHHQESGMVETG